MNSECYQLIAGYRKLLDDFGITMTPELEKKLEELYPSDIAMENHVRTIIMTYLSLREG